MVEHYTSGAWGEIPSPSSKLRTRMTPEKRGNGRVTISGTAVTRTIAIRVKWPQVHAKCE